ncbi:Activated RNA polymerase II transcriptional coactivator p15 [Mizuhopecten yessoensis]|uniref:Activated RNA polymerase II transcriptional coactivator p15 n=1 Tax=Mizuhopecten yessoensis TaxID=6573 RepID=A0A210Q903_MIZYE|nr:Activated RNA polymerase II transcriptional coactivator p15 [Mizuhopecten yessoensis]
MAEPPRSPVVVPAALLPKRRHLAKRRILDTDVATSLRKKLFFFDENARESFEEEPDVLIIDDSPIKKVKMETSKCSMHGAGVDLKSPLKEKSKDIEENKLCQLDIGNDHYVVASRFQGRLYIHIRIYEKRPDNTTYPTKKGITLDLEKWTKLMTWYSDDVDEAIKGYDDETKDTDLKIHLGSNYHVSLNTGYPVVNIRRWFLSDNEKEIKPTRKGITLTFRQWGKVKDAMTVLKDFIGKELENVTFCEMAEDHQNQMGMLQCSKCNPNGTMMLGGGFCPTMRSRLMRELNSKKQ